MQPTHPQKISGRTKLALWLMIGPTALFIVTLVLYAAFNWILSGSSSPSLVECLQSVESGVPDDNGITRVADESCDENSLDSSASNTLAIINIITFIMGLIVFITWLPGLITGIILLATKPKVAR